MKLRLVFRRAARKEFDDAKRWYEQQQTGLGGEFIEEVERALQAIVVQPDRFPFAQDDIRVARVMRFPYSVYYRVKTDRIVVISVFHSSRSGYLAVEEIESANFFKIFRKRKRAISPANVVSGSRNCCHRVRVSAAIRYRCLDLFVLGVISARNLHGS